MNPTTLGVIGPGFLNQVPTLFTVVNGDTRLTSRCASTLNLDPKSKPYVALRSEFSLCTVGWLGVEAKSALP